MLGTSLFVMLNGSDFLFLLIAFTFAFQSDYSSAVIHVKGF